MCRISLSGVVLMGRERSLVSWSCRIRDCKCALRGGGRPWPISWRGIDEEQTWALHLPARSIRLGRTAKIATSSADRAPGVHATLLWQDGKLLVRKEAAARNQIFVHGAAQDEFRLSVGDQFVIGDTTFTVVSNYPPPGQSNALSELSCSRQELAEVRYTDADQRIEMLAALPGIIRYSPSDEELEGRVVDVLLKTIPVRGCRRSRRECFRAGGFVGRPRSRLGRSSRVSAVGIGELQPSRRLILDGFGTTLKA